MKWLMRIGLGVTFTASLMGDPTVTVQGRSPHPVDQYVRIDVETNDWLEVQCNAANAFGYFEVDYKDGLPSHLRCFYAAKTPGDLEVRISGHPMSSHPEPLVVTIPFIEPRVSPALEIPAAFAEQKRANLPRAVVRAVTPRQAYIVGEEVEVEWIGIAPETPSGLQAETAELTAVDWSSCDTPPNATGVSWKDRRNMRATRRRSAVGGEFVTENGLMRFSFTPDHVGVYEIPAMGFSGNASVWKAIWQNRLETRFITWSNPLSITVTQAPPEAAGLPIGRLSLQCAQFERGPWPGFTVDVKGAENLARIPAPEFVIPLADTVVIRKDTWGTWLYELHTDRPSIKPPPVQIAFFNPDTRRRETSQCSAGEIMQSNRYTLRSVMKAEAKKESAPGADPTKYGDYLYPYTIAAGAFAFGALVLLVQAFRD
jgi:hypothetical protein